MTRDPPGTDELGAAIQAASADVRAPQALRERVEALRSARRGGHPLLLVLAGAAAVVASALAIVLVAGLVGSGGRIEGPTLARAAGVALRPATEAPPVEDATDPVLVEASIAGLRFPYWDDQFGLEAVAMRHDAVGGRPALTVEYRGGRDESVSYMILSGKPVSVPADADWVRRGRLPLAVLTRGGATVVTWQRAGHTCVLSSRGTPARRLLALAAWTGEGRVGGYGG